MEAHASEENEEAGVGDTRPARALLRFGLSHSPVLGEGFLGV